MSNISKKYKYNSRRLTKTKLLMLGALLFSLGVGTSVTATYAWYTLREFSSISNLNLQIDALDEDAYLKLYLDKDGEKIHKEDGYTKEDLGIKDEDGNERELTDVSGMFQDKWLNTDTDMHAAFPMLRTSYRTALGVNTTDPGVANRNTGKDFFVQNVFYLEAGMDCHIYLAEDSDISANQEQNEIVARTKGKNLDKLNQVAHTVRTSFFTDEGYVIAQPDDNDYETYYGGILDLNKDGTYDNKDGKEIYYGEFDGEVPYRSQPETNPPHYEGDDITTFHSNHGDGITQVDVEKAYEQTKKENAKKIKDVTYINTSSHKEEYDNGTRSMAQDIILNKKATPLCAVHKGEKKRIVVSVYVEGWDRYMTDDIASACFDINISFTALFDI